MSAIVQRCDERDACSFTAANTDNTRVLQSTFGYRFHNLNTEWACMCLLWLLLSLLGQTFFAETAQESDLVAAVEDAIKDGVDIINYSVSSSTFTFRDPIMVAFLNAGKIY